MSLKILEADLEICFVENILDAMMKSAPVRFLCILGVLYVIRCVYFFSVTLKTKRLVYSIFWSINSSQLLLDLQ